MSVFESFLVLAFLYGVACARYNEFERVPQNTTVIKGSSVVLRCQVYEGYLGYEFPVYWEMNGRIINPRTSRTKRYTLIEDKDEGIYDLEIRSVTEDDDGMYVCVIDFPDPSGDGKSSPGELHVIKIPIPRFLQEPENTTVVEGGNVSLNCQIGDFTAGKLGVFWEQSGPGLQSRANSVSTYTSQYTTATERDRNGNFNLMLNSVSRQDAGDYRCVVTVVNGEGYVLESRKARLSVVNTTCKIQSPAQQNKVFEEGDNITVACTARIDPLSSVLLMWSKNGTEFPGTKVHSESVDIRDTWSLTPDDDNGTITCNLKNSGSSSKQICAIGSISVNYAPIVTILPLSPKAVQGGRLTLTCSARANPNVNNYEWMIKMADSRYSIDKSGRSLTIRELRNTDDGVEVECVARNGKKLRATSVRIRVTEFSTTSTPSDEYNNTSEIKQNTPSAFIIVGCTLVLTLFLVVVVLVGVFCYFKRNRQRRNKNGESNGGNSTFQHPSSNDRRDNTQDISSMTEFPEYEELKTRNTRIADSTLHATKPEGLSEQEVTTIGHGQAEVVYAQVNKKMKTKGKPSYGGNEEAAITYQNTSTVSRPDTASADVVENGARSEAGDAPSRNMEGLVYAELDLTNHPGPEQRSTATSEPPTIYAELHHP